MYNKRKKKMTEKQFTHKQGARKKMKEKQGCTTREPRGTQEYKHCGLIGDKTPVHTGEDNQTGRKQKVKEAA